MDLVLHVADENGRINLEGVIPPGAHYTAQRNENTGVVRLVPVKVATTAVQPTTASAGDTNVPWTADQPTG